eukprot:2027045-Prymnesium_polylepis.1
MGRAHCWAWSLPPSLHKVTARRSRTRLLLLVLQPLRRPQSDPAREGMETLISRCAGGRVCGRVCAGVRAGAVCK